MTRIMPRIRRVDAREITPRATGGPAGSGSTAHERDGPLLHTRSEAAHRRQLLRVLRVRAVEGLEHAALELVHAARSEVRVGPRVGLPLDGADRRLVLDHRDRAEVMDLVERRGVRALGLHGRSDLAPCVRELLLVEAQQLGEGRGLLPEGVRALQQRGERLHDCGRRGQSGAGGANGVVERRSESRQLGADDRRPLQRRPEAAHHRAEVAQDGAQGARETAGRWPAFRAARAAPAERLEPSPAGPPHGSR